MQVKVLGSGCSNCEKLVELLKKAGDELGVAESLNIEKVTDYAEIAAYGIMATPGLVIDEEVKVAGRVPPYPQIRQMLVDTLAAGQA